MDVHKEDVCILIRPIIINMFAIFIVITIIIVNVVCVLDLYNHI